MTEKLKKAFLEYMTDVIHNLDYEYMDWFIEEHNLSDDTVSKLCDYQLILKVVEENDE